MTIYVQGRNAGEVWITGESGVKQLKITTATTSPAEAFVNTVLKGKENLSPASECIYPVALTEAVYRSASEHKPAQLSI